MLNNLVLREAGLRQVTCKVREHQVCLYEHVARLTAEAPAHRICLVLIRGDGLCRGTVRVLHGCTELSLI